MKKEIKLKENGFTLMELMVTLTIAAILLTLAVPSFRTFIQNSRMISQSNALLSAFHLARSESIKRVVDITVCSSTNGSTCSKNTGGADGTDWSTGWIVVEEAPDPNDDPVNIMKVWGALPGGAALVTILTATSTAGNTSVVFTSAGTANTKPCFSLTIPGSAESRRRYIAISATGHPSSKTACP